ncbi:MAG: hypothetical protein QOG63_1313 [Thermoleophilaceae bacterium]|jgi:hypothetical protein|nr:hypothetical protein [Thermoleophilaceae bacterium]
MKRILTLLIAGSLALAGGAQAKHGADDPAGHVRHGRGADDVQPHHKHGADDPAGHVRHQHHRRHHHRHGADDPAGHR